MQRLLSELCIGASWPMQSSCSTTESVLIAQDCHMGYMGAFELIRGLATQLNSMSTELDALGQHGTGQQ